MFSRAGVGFSLIISFIGISLGLAVSTESVEYAVAVVTTSLALIAVSGFTLLMVATVFSEKEKEDLIVKFTLTRISATLNSVLAGVTALVVLPGLPVVPAATRLWVGGTVLLVLGTISALTMAVVSKRTEEKQLAPQTNGPTPNN